MATISEYRGKFKCQVRIKGYPPRSATFGTEQDARDWGNEIEEQMRSGTYGTDKVQPPPETVKALLARYWKEVKADDKRYNARINRLTSKFGKYSVHHLKPEMITAYKNERLTVAAPQTVLHELVVLHHAYKVAVQEWGLRLKHGIPKTRRPRPRVLRGYRLTPGIVQSLILATESKMLPRVLEFAIETCMRRAEIAGITPEDINLNTGTVRLGRTKNGTARTVPLSPKAQAILRGLPKVPTGEPVFQLTADSITQAFDRAALRIGMPYLHFHDTRHEGISRLFERGFSMVEVQKVSGHKTLSQLNRYVHLDVGHIVRRLAA